MTLLHGSLLFTSFHFLFVPIFTFTAHHMILHVYFISLLFSVTHGLHMMSIPFPHVFPISPCI